MMPSLQFGIIAFTSLVVIVNPLNAVPVFVALTDGYTAERKRVVVRRAIVTSFVILLLFAALGTAILKFFGITTQAFRIAGGVLFFGVGWDMLQARRSRVKTTEEEESESVGKEEVGIIPLGLPTLVGPGAITTVIALNGQASDPAEVGFVYVAIVLSMIVSWLVLASAPALSRRMGKTSMNVMTRLMGLIVMVIGVQFVIDGMTVVVQDIVSSLRA